MPVGWEDRARDLLERFDLGGVAHRVTGGFSHGMGRRMSVILAAFHQPAVLLLDEPFDGVDPLGVEATMEVIADARAHGAAVLVSTHLRELAVQACQHAIVLRGGSAVAEMAAADMGGEDGRRCSTAPCSTAGAEADDLGQRPRAARRPARWLDWKRGRHARLRDPGAFRAAGRAPPAPLPARAASGTSPSGRPDGALGPRPGHAAGVRRTRVEYTGQPPGRADPAADGATSASW